MIISSGQFKVNKNRNSKTTKFFGEVEVGNIVEVNVNLGVYVSGRVSDKLITVHNITKGTSRTDAPIYLNAGLTKMVLEPIQEKNEAEYQRGYQDASSELQMAYFGGYIEELFENEDEE